MLNHRQQHIMEDDEEGLWVQIQREFLALLHSMCNSYVAQ